jgi:hypothetical protein
MRDGPTDEVLAGSCRWSCIVTSWLGSTLLAAAVPVSTGKASAKVDQDVPEKLTITVPRFAAPNAGDPQFDWRPTTPDHPLARYGQQLDVSIVVTSTVTAQSWTTRIGRYKITDWADDDQGTVTVNAEGGLGWVRDNLITVPMSPVGSLVTEAQRLTPLGMGISFDPALTDRAVPTSMSWSDDRLGAMKEIADAWPALLRTDEWGQILYKSPLPPVPSPVMTLHDGSGGTVMLAPGSDTRSEAYNQVLAQTSNATATDIQGIASATSGPMSVNGPYGVVTKKWSSPLITTVDEANAAAATMLANSMRPALSFPIQIAPDPRVDIDDPVLVLRTGLPDQIGYVVGYEIPLTVADGYMTVDVGVTQ